jgi:hypothetical protein
LGCGNDFKIIALTPGSSTKMWQEGWSAWPALDDRHVSEFSVLSPVFFWSTNPCAPPSPPRPLFPIIFFSCPLHC